MATAAGTRHGAYERGFTLVELVVVIAITAIVASLSVSFIRLPIVGYSDVARRAELVSAADSALSRIARDVRSALPNSIRVSPAGNALEFLRAAEGARYRAEPDPPPGTVHDAPSDTLEFSVADASFNVLGRFNALAYTPGVPLPLGYRIAVYSTGAAVWSDAASGANPGVITSGGTTITIDLDVDEDQITLSTGHQFALASPRRRMYIVDTPVTYLCAVGPGTITRYDAYAPTAIQPTDPAIPPLSTAADALLTNRVTACDFTYQAGTSERAGLVTAALTLQDGAETVRILRQAHVVNAP